MNDLEFENIDPQIENRDSVGFQTDSLNRLSDSCGEGAVQNKFEFIKQAWLGTARSILPLQISIAGNCPLVSASYLCTQGNHLFRLQLKSYKKSKYRAHYELSYLPEGVGLSPQKTKTFKYELMLNKDNDCAALSLSQQAILIRNDLFGDGFDRLVFHLKHPELLTIDHLAGEYDDEEPPSVHSTESVSETVCKWKEPLSSSSETHPVLLSSSFDRTQVEQIDEQDELSVRHCPESHRGFGYLQHTLTGWMNASHATATHNSVIEHIKGYFEGNKPDRMHLFSICNRKGEVMAVGVLDPEVISESMIVQQLVSRPDLNGQGKGAGRAAIKYSIQQALLHSKRHLLLNSEDTSRGFYFRMGLVANPTKPDHWATFTLDWSEMLETFPEFRSALKTHSR